MLYSEFKNKVIQTLNTIYNKNECVTIAKHLFSKLTSLRFEHVNEMNLECYLEKNSYPMAEEYLKLLLQKMPIQYVIGEAYFDKHTFFVSPQVLIPRPETEELVELISQHISKQETPINCIDLCTGSGCIAISLKKRFEHISMTGIDISKQAIEVAQHNAQHLKADIHFITAPLEKLMCFSKYNIIVSNPPYIEENELNHLLPQVKGFEPHIALFEPKEKPLYFYHLIAHWSKNNILKNGIVFLEINESKGKDVQELFHQYDYKEVYLEQDMNRKNRFVVATL